jgi:hypothetical protein
MGPNVDKAAPEGDGAPEAKWLALMRDDRAIRRMTDRLMDSISMETDAIHVSTPDTAEDLIRDLILAAVGGQRSNYLASLEFQPIE